MKKKTLLATALSAAGVIMSLAWFSPPPEPAPINEEEQEILQSPFDRQPPVVEQITLQKLMTPLANGDNLIIRIKYASEFSLPTQLKIYTGDNSSVMVYDDGLNTLSDTYAGDNWFGTTINENLPALITNIQTQEALLVEQGRMVVFKGREGQILTEIPQFNVSEFNNGLEVPLPTVALRTFECGNSILRQNSLFITDLSVVEDPERTFNIITNTGAPVGAWTFGRMMQNAANTAVTGVSAKDFMKSWVRNWMTTQTVNSLASYPRPNAFGLLIKRWLAMAGETGITEANWENKWDGADEYELLKYAPFKLTAIVNRLDLRANTAYTGEVGDRAGETRFIFSLISLGSEFNLDNSTAGDVPIHVFDDFVVKNYADWRGMNVIFEYHNTCQNRCEIKDLAGKWAELSQLTLGSGLYNTKLEVITNQVVNSNALPNDPNGSALARIRTNERVFIPSLPVLPQTANDLWRDGNWQFRQFEIDRDAHLLAQVPLTNTPRYDANYTTNHDPSIVVQPSPNYNSHVLNWVLDPQNSLNVILGRHQLPNEYAGTPIKAADGPVTNNFHFNFAFEFPYTSATENYSHISIEDRGRLRHQIALNTCQGCHASETKTVFTQMYPRGYGQSANYWQTTPDGIENFVDERFSTNYRSHPITMEPLYKKYLSSPLKVQKLPIVSAFITGRNYRGAILPGANYYTDDDPGDADDDNMDGLFMVWDPANWDTYGNYNTYYESLEKRYGFNELLRRKIDLCKLISLGCDAGNETLQIANGVEEQPFALDAH